MQHEIFRSLALKYFEGKSSSKEESILLDFINISDINKRLFDNWEKEWVKIQRNSLQGQKEWKTFSQQFEPEEKPEERTRINIFSVFKNKVAVAICILGLGLGTLFTILKITENYSNNNVFIIEAPKGEKSKIKLSDGTIVWLNAGSVLSYKGNFNVKNRTIRLLGEAYFEVKNQNNEFFTVKTSKYDVIVKGTKFNISSYDEDGYITTSLIEGAVDLVYNGDTFRMKPGEMILLDINKDTLIKSNGRSSQYKSWTENKIEYDAISLEDLMRRLSRQYNVNIHVEAKDIKGKILNVSLNNSDPIEEIMKGLSKIVPINIYYEKDNIYVR